MEGASLPKKKKTWHIADYFKCTKLKTDLKKGALIQLSNNMPMISCKDLKVKGWQAGKKN